MKLDMKAGVEVIVFARNIARDAFRITNETNGPLSVRYDDLVHVLSPSATLFHPYHTFMIWTGQVRATCMVDGQIDVEEEEYSQ